MGNKGNSTDECMRKLYIHLVSDFRTRFGQQYAAAPLGAFLSGGIKMLRGYAFPSRCCVSPDIFKADYQLEALFKRYRFKDDVYTDQELLDMAKEKFLGTQVRLAKGFTVTPLIHQVLVEARRFAKDILGEYSVEEHRALCQFGKRACVGTGFAESTLDVKLSKPLTGSQEHIRWFKNYLNTDELLRDAIKEASGKRRPSYRVCDTLTMSHVPKSFKALRGIIPDTLLGSFYTNGLGKLLSKRLRSAGLDIRVLQQRHGILAQKNSRTRKFVTADLSAASDSLTPHLLRRVLPLPWYRAAVYGRIPHIDLLGDRVRMETVLTMGLGHTFPLQTLVFYCLLKAIGRLALGRDVYVSVYGDDLIYPRKIHRYVAAIFPKVGLLLNGDKTYVEDYFRESCGSDFYRGSDVRPFSPEGEYQLKHGLHYGQFLYKILNGLRRRWDASQIPRTIEFLKCEIILHVGEILYVPPSFPDTSGYKVFEHDGAYLCAYHEPDRNTFSNRFTFIQQRNKRRESLSQCCYYWEWLRERSHIEIAHDYSDPSDTPILMVKNYYKWRKGKKIVVRVVAQTVDKRSIETLLTSSITTVFGLPPEYGDLVTSNHPKVLASNFFKFKTLKRSWRGGCRFFSRI